MPAHTIFFPAAALYAAFAVPVSVASMLGWIAPVPGLATPVGHAHEMVFGFGLAAVAGNQLGPVKRATLAALFVSWLAARASFLFAPASIATGLANAFFAALLAWQLVPRLAAPIRKLRNRALPATVAALCAAGIAMQAALRAGSGRAQETLLLAAIMVLSLLMLFMGGRIIAPAAAGHAYRTGGDLAARVQPGIEGGLIVAMFAAIAALLARLDSLAALGLAIAAVLAAVRLARWQPWKLRGRADIACLVVGYAWLAVGLLAIAAALQAGVRPVTAIHVITIGAMGTLTVNVMALTYARIARRDPAAQRLPVWATLLVALAVVARVGADVAAQDPRAGLACAAASWSAAYLLTLASFLRMRR